MQDIIDKLIIEFQVLRLQHKDKEAQRVLSEIERLQKRLDEMDPKAPETKK